MLLLKCYITVIGNVNIKCYITVIGNVTMKCILLLTLFNMLFNERWIKFKDAVNKMLDRRQSKWMLNAGVL